MLEETEGGRDWAGFEELDPYSIFGQFERSDSQSFDSSMDFGLKHGCMQIVAATAYSLYQRRRDFETVALGSCRLVAEQEPTFRAARFLQDQNYQTALYIAHALLSEAIEAESVVRDGDEQRWSLAFHYTEHVSKLALTLQQCTQLLEHSTAALTMYDDLVQKRDSSDTDDISWFRFQDLNSPAQVNKDKPLRQYLQKVNSVQIPTGGSGGEARAAAAAAAALSPSWSHTARLFAAETESVSEGGFGFGGATATTAAAAPEPETEGLVLEGPAFSTPEKAVGPGVGGAHGMASSGQEVGPIEALVRLCLADRAMTAQELAEAADSAVASAPAAIASAVQRVIEEAGEFRMPCVLSCVFLCGSIRAGSGGQNM